MKLSDLNLFTKALITSIKADTEVTTRLHSLGLFEESEICITNIFIAKQTIQIQNEDGTMIALRLEEAKNIYVRLLA